MDAVATLMLERQRFEAWLAQLESRRAITPPHVFERVRADYEKRLREVTEQLTSRTTEVQATMAALTERLARLQTDETALRDERYEAELRSHVGEMTASEWEKLQRDSDERIARIGTERTTVTGEIARLQQLLSMSRDRSTLPSEASLSRDTAKPAPVKGGPGFDELEFLKSVTDGSKAGAAGGAPGARRRGSRPRPRPTPFAPRARYRGARPPPARQRRHRRRRPPSPPPDSAGPGRATAGTTRSPPSRPRSPTRSPRSCATCRRRQPRPSSAATAAR